MEQTGYTILLVEDDKVDQLAFVRFAEKEDFPYQYVIAGSVEETRTLLQSQRFDVTVVDYLLGDGIAFDLFKDFHDIPIIIVTGIGNEEIAVNAMKAGAYDYLIKDPEGHYLKTLSMTVENAIKRKQSEDELRRYREHLEELVDIRTAELKKEIEDRKRAEEELQSSVREKEVLLRELHHRVKNNLQVISSLLDLQSEDIENPQAREIFLEAQNRVRSMAHIHEQLYQSSNLAALDVAAYIEQLVHTLLQSYGRTSITPEFQVTNVPLDIDTAISCGLIINELVSNALKYAFPINQETSHPVHKIRVTLSPQQHGILSLVIQDNGIGFPALLSGEPQTISFGLRLVNMLVRQLKGDIDIDGTQGTTVTLTFPIPKHLLEEQNRVKTYTAEFHKY